MTPTYRPDEAFALEMDAADPLRGFRAEFELPTRRAIAGLAGGPGLGGSGGAGDEACVYLCGNSLGCMPRRARELLNQELDDWSAIGVDGHEHARRPWLPYHEQLRGPLGRLVGAGDREVVAMNSLTVNLHLLMISFYRPTRERFKILIEDAAFPSDSYAVQSQADFHAHSAGFDPGTAIIRLRPREGEHTLRTEDVLSVIDREAGSIALVMLGAVNYLTGQWFDMPEITRFAKARGCVVGWDLAHAAGNVPVRLHDWDIDFAAWCSYKYLNGGPGALAGAFVHEKHHADDALPRLAGWWSNEPGTRFKMAPRLAPTRSADAWSLSNPPIFSMTPLIASLEQFDRAGIGALRAKAITLTGYLEWWIDRINQQRPGSPMRIVTPRDPAQRGCHLSIIMPGDAKGTMQRLKQAGVVGDFREPNVVRLAPAPLYNSFTDVYRAGTLLQGLI